METTAECLEAHYRFVKGDSRRLLRFPHGGNGGGSGGDNDDDAVTRRRYNEDDDGDDDVNADARPTDRHRTAAR